MHRFNCKRGKLWYDTNMASLCTLTVLPLKRALTFLLLAALATGCATVPMTNRRQLRLVSSQQMVSLSAVQYQEVLETAKLVKSGPQLQQVQRVGHRITDAVEEYYREEGIPQNFKWEFALIDGEQVNAWCMPGGKIAFYTGILPICQSDAGVATVMGHEIAHAMAEHGNERFSQGLLAQFGTAAANEVLKERDPKTQQLFATAIGLGTQVGVLLPFSRLQESEADQIGLMLMARAGYNPEAAVSFWQRMKENANGKQPPEFLSTHPSNDRRIEEIRAMLPKVRRYYTEAESTE